MNENQNRIYLNDNLKDIKMGSEELYGKYPSIHFTFDNYSLRISINEKELDRIKEFLNHITISHGRWFSDGNDEDFEYKYE